MHLMLLIFPWLGKLNANKWNLSIMTGIMEPIWYPPHLPLSGTFWAFDQPIPLEFPNPTVGVWIFSGTTRFKMLIFVIPDL